MRFLLLSLKFNNNYANKHTQTQPYSQLLNELFPLPPSSRHGSTITPAPASKVLASLHVSLYATTVKNN